MRNNLSAPIKIVGPPKTWFLSPKMPRIWQKIKNLSVVRILNKIKLKNLIRSDNYEICETLCAVFCQARDYALAYTFIALPLSRRRDVTTTTRCQMFLMSQVACICVCGCVCLGVRVSVSRMNYLLSIRQDFLASSRYTYIFICNIYTSVYQTYIHVYKHRTCMALERGASEHEPSGCKTIRTTFVSIWCIFCGYIQHLCGSIRCSKFNGY